MKQMLFGTFRASGYLLAGATKGRIACCICQLVCLLFSCSQFGVLLKSWQSTVVQYPLLSLPKHDLVGKTLAFMQHPKPEISKQTGGRTRGGKRRASRGAPCQAHEIVPELLRCAEPVVTQQQRQALRCNSFWLVGRSSALSLNRWHFLFAGAPLL